MIELTGLLKTSNKYYEEMEETPKKGYTKND